jgi:hypothetical protein
MGETESAAAPGAESPAQPEPVTPGATEPAEPAPPAPGTGGGGLDPDNTYEV